jgi:hypothetical protein
MHNDPDDLRLLRPDEVARALFGVNNRAARHRVYRLIDSGAVACVRVGERGDRRIPACVTCSTRADGGRRRSDRYDSGMSPCRGSAARSSRMSANRSCVAASTSAMVA